MIHASWFRGPLDPRPEAFRPLSSPRSSFRHSRFNAPPRFSNRLASRQVSSPDHPWNPNADDPRIVVQRSPGFPRKTSRLESRESAPPPEAFRPLSSPRSSFSEFLLVSNRLVSRQVSSPSAEFAGRNPISTVHLLTNFSRFRHVLATEQS